MDTEDAMSVTEIQKETNFALEPLGFTLVTRKVSLLILGYWCKPKKSLKVFYRLYRAYQLEKQPFVFKPN